MRPTAKQLLSSAGMPSLLVSSSYNIRYLTGIDAESSLLLVLPRGYVLFIDTDFFDVAVDRLLPGVDVRPLTALQGTLARVPLCHFEEGSVLVSRLRRWKQTFKQTKFASSGGSVEAFRRQKSPEEMQKMRRALRITEEILRRIPSVLRVGVTESSVAWKIEIWAHELGADALAFSPIVGFGTHTAILHHRPTSRRLHRPDIVQIDIGVKVRGYCSDRSEVYFAGRQTVEQEQVYRAVLEAKETMKNAAKAGMMTDALYERGAAVLSSHGIEQKYCKGYAHGVGLEVHEGVVISPRQPAQKLVPGEVITIEPGVYIPGKFGVRLEDMVFLG